MTLRWVGRTQVSRSTDRKWTLTWKSSWLLLSTSSRSISTSRKYSSLLNRFLMFVYLITNTVNGKQYIGQTVQIKNKISLSLKGIPKPNYRKPFKCVENGKIYNTLEECAKDMNCHKTSVSKVLKKKRNNVYG